MVTERARFLTWGKPDVQSGSAWMRALATEFADDTTPDGNPVTPTDPDRTPLTVESRVLSAADEIEVARLVGALTGDDESDPAIDYAPSADVYQR